MTEFENEQNTELKRMQQHRNCPPISALIGGGEEIEQHLINCPACRERLEDAPSLLNALKRHFPQNDENVSCVHVGEIRIIKSDSVSSTYNKHGWHNPPRVVVYETETGIPGMVRVAQLHDSKALADVGDIELTETGRYFAESYNTYPQFVDALSAPIGHATEEEIERIRDFENDPVNYWPQEHSACYLFRETELNIGGFYGMRASMRGVNILETRPE